VKHKYFRSAPAKQNDSIQIDRESSVIRGLVMCQVGEAKGHGVHMEQSFIDELVRLANQYPKGLKARFGHPNMCSEALGTEMGRVSNWRVEGERALADLTFSAAAAISPTHGNMPDWVMTTAEEDPNLIGFSIVFTAKKEAYYYDDEGHQIFVTSEYDVPADKKCFVQIAKIHGSDLVDEPAATEGLFSTNLHAETITNFLDEHPEIFTLLHNRPELFNEFMARYNSNKPLRTSPVTTTTHMNKPAKPAPKESTFSRLLKALGLKKFDIPVTTEDGTAITIITESESPAVGDLVVITETSEPAPDGDHVIAGGDMDGTIITTVDGAITEINDGSEPEDSPEDDAELEAQLAALQAENNRLKVLNASLRKRVPGATPTRVTPASDTSLSDAKDLKEQLMNESWNAQANKPKKSFRNK
jgi:hypothetical protein